MANTPFTRTFYRIVKTADGKYPNDYASNCEKGQHRRPEAGETTIEQWTGISVYDSLEQARKPVLMGRFGRRRRWIAELAISLDGPFEFKKTAGPGHWTLWGSAPLICARVVEVHEVDTEWARR